jgi:hypothetical protein
MTMFGKLFGGGANAGEFTGPFHRPYRDEAANHLYNLLFCDSLALFRGKGEPKPEPWTTLLADKASESDLRSIADNPATESRVRALAFNKLRAMGKPVPAKIHLGTIIEMPVETGLDKLAAFPDHEVRYINQSGKMAIFAPAPASLHARIDALMQVAQLLVQRIGPWDKARLPPPQRGSARLNFLVSDGLYFGQGPVDDLMRDQLGGAVIQAGGLLLQDVVNAALAADKSKQSTA